MNMRIIVVEDYQKMSRQAARFIAQKILLNPNLVVALPTGNTPLGLYHELVRMFKEGLLNFSQITVFNLDEYLGLSPQHPQTFRSYMQEYFWNHVNLRPESCHIPSSLPEDPETECARYEQLIETCGGLDLAVLGIGENGHIAFNEPGTPFESLTHVARLSPETRAREASRFGGLDKVPTHAITMGIKTIMHAREILLLASGEEKADALSRSLKGPVTPEIPASILQLHPNLTVIADSSAAKHL
jgi:glucosamine-6-phosphate deaminase